MKSKLLQISTVAAAMLLAGSAVAQNQTVFKPTLNQKMAQTAEKAPESIPYTVVFEEDFSKFTAGSETNPDKTDLLLGENSYEIDPDYTAQPRWRGNCVWQAGGAAYIGSYEDEYYGHMIGFISTPSAMLYGDLIVTVEAKIPSNINADGYKLDVSLCDDYYGPSDRKQFDLTNDWQTFVFKTDQAAFDVENYIQITCYESEYMVRYVKVERAITKIAAPEAFPAENLSATSFVASWMETEEADDYLLTVYYKDMPADAVEPGTWVESFDGINTVNGKIDTANPNYPEGWTISLLATGDKDVTTAADSHSSGKQAIILDEMGEYILSPVTPAPLSSISFWVKPQSPGSDDWMNCSMISVKVLVDGNWEYMGNLNTYFLPDGDVWEMSLPVLVEGATQLCLEYACNGTGDNSFAIDDVTLSYAPQTVPFEFITDLPVTGDSYIVENYDNTKEHYYYVKARSGELLSQPSNSVWVDGLTGVAAEMGEPTNVTETGFTANWPGFVTATSYQLDLQKQISASADGEEFVLLSEDFSGVSAPGGTFDAPVTSYNGVEFLAAKGFTKADWICQLPAYVDGMAGAQHTNYWLGKAGLVVSPRLSLDNGDGAFNVAFRAYMTDPEDQLIVMLLKEYSDTQAIVGVGINYNGEEPGFIETTAVFPAASDAYPMAVRKDIKVAFMSATGNPFFIDNVTVTQKFYEGESTFVPCATIFTTDNTYTFADLEPADAYGIAVKASASKDYVDYSSEWSETKIVSLGASVRDLAIGSSVAVRPVGNTLIVNTPDTVEVQFYNLQGMHLNTVLAPAGTSTIDCSALRGHFLVVKAGGKVIKCRM